MLWSTETTLLGEAASSLWSPFGCRQARRCCRVSAWATQHRCTFCPPLPLGLDTLTLLMLWTLRAMLIVRKVQNTNLPGKMPQPVTSPFISAPPATIMVRGRGTEHRMALFPLSMAPSTVLPLVMHGLVVLGPVQLQPPVTLFCPALRLPSSLTKRESHASQARGPQGCRLSFSPVPDEHLSSETRYSAAPLLLYFEAYLGLGGALSPAKCKVRRKILAWGRTLGP